MSRFLRLICVSLSVLFSAGNLTAETNAPSLEVAPRRPRIGLALGGGGALGIAHIGVLQALEKMRVPVDFIGGTSMGSIIAGIYASGMSPDEMEAVFSSLDWWDLMKDKTPYRDLDFNRKIESARYLMDLELGLRGFRILFPHGFAAGQKLNNLMKKLTVNSAGIESFDDLNIPFRAVATDLRTGSPVILDRGDLAMAMRASMAVPGVFTPVLMNGYLMVDGGLVNNIPVDVIKDLGADIVIAVDVGASGEVSVKGTTFESLGQILARTYDIMQRPKDSERRKAADVLIEPQLDGLSSSDFHRTPELVPRGFEAVEALASQLKAYALDQEAYDQWLAGQRHQRDTEKVIRNVTITGNKVVSTNSILKRVNTRTGDKVDFNTLDKDAAHIHGMGSFLTVTHNLVPTGTPGEYDLQYGATEKYWGPTFLHFGLRLQSDLDEATFWSMLLNIRRTALNALGGELITDLELGRKQAAELEWYQPLQSRGTFFIAPSASVSSETEDLFDDGDKVAEYQKDVYAAQMDAGVQFSQYAELRAGVRSGHLKATPTVGADDAQRADADIGAFTGSLAYDRLDARVFPRSGTYANLIGYFSSDELGAQDDYDKISGRIRKVLSVGEHTFDISVQGGSALDSDVPVYDQFTLGGIFTLPGVNPGELRGPYFGVAGINYRYRVGRLSPSMGQGIYLLGGVHAGNVWGSSDDIALDDHVVGTLLGVALDTIFGPVAFGAGRAEGDRSQLYLNVGTIF